MMLLKRNVNAVTSLLLLLVSSVVIVTAKDHDGTRRRRQLRQPAQHTLAHQHEDRDLQDSSSCIENLSLVAEEGSNQVTAQEFLNFIVLESNGRQEYETFQDVPLDLRLLFYATACSGGRDCTWQAPTILLNGDGMSSTLLHIFCNQAEKFVKESATPASFKIFFRYSLYYKNDASLEEIMEARSDEDGIIARLETATQRVVSSALACPLDSARRRRLDDDKSVNTIHVPSLYKDESQLLVNVLTPRELEYCSQQARQLQEECKYSITAVVEDLLPFDCDPPAPSDDVSCAIVGSSVVLTAMDDANEISPQEQDLVRATVVNALSNAINDGTFENHLP